MRKLNIKIAILVFLTCMSAPHLVKAKSSKNKEKCRVDFVTPKNGSLKKVFKKAKKQGKFIYLLLISPTSSSCKRMYRNVLSNRLLAMYLEEFTIPVLVDTSTPNGREICNKYPCPKVPYLHVLAPDGSVVKSRRATRDHPVRELRLCLGKMNDDSKKLEELLEKMTKKVSASKASATDASIIANIARKAGIAKIPEEYYYFDIESKLKTSLDRYYYADFWMRDDNLKNLEGALRISEELVKREKYSSDLWCYEQLYAWCLLRNNSVSQAIKVMNSAAKNCKEDPDVQADIYKDLETFVKYEKQLNKK